MQRIPSLDPQTTTGKAKDYFVAIEKKLGMVPNMMRAMGNSPAALNGYLSFSAALGESSIGGKLGELIALTVAKANGCDYCGAAHTFIGKKLLGIESNALVLAKEAKSQNAKTEAALQFALRIVETKGRVSKQDIDAVKNAGFDNAAVAEIIAHTALNIYTNYFNNAAEVVVDFPEVLSNEPTLN